MPKITVATSTEPIDHGFGLFVSVDDRYLHLLGSSPAPVVRATHGKLPLLVMANEPDLIGNLVIALRAAADALDRQRSLLLDTITTTDN